MKFILKALVKKTVVSDEPYKRVENGIEEDRKIYFSAKVSDS